MLLPEPVVGRFTVGICATAGLAVGLAGRVRELESQSRDDKTERRGRGAATGESAGEHDSSACELTSCAAG